LISFGFNILFAIPIHLALLIHHICAGVKAISTGVKLWKPTFQVDNNNTFGVLQFKTKAKHNKVQMECCFYATSSIITYMNPPKTMFYHEVSRSVLPGGTVNRYMHHINNILQYVWPQTAFVMLILIISWRINRRL
jgi:hypothetical protein